MTLFDRFRKFSAILLGSIILVVTSWLIFVGVLSLSFKIWDHFFKFNNPLSGKYGAKLQDVYKGYSVNEINQLLKETWREQTPELPIGLRETPFQGKYVNVAPHGFRISTNQGPWPLDSQAFNIFIFGGSTAYGYGVEDWNTIASHLSNKFKSFPTKKRVYVYNFSRGGHRSNLERMVYEKLLTAGITPNLAIFIDGLNDFEYPEDDGVATERLKAFLHHRPFTQIYFGVSSLLRSENVSRLVFALNREIQTRLKIPKKEIQGRDQKISSNEAKTVVEHYLTNKKIIESVSKGFGVTPIFVWQPIPYYKYDLSYHPLAKLTIGGRAEFGYPTAAEIIQKKNPSENLLWAADIQEELGLTDGLYVDNVHYSGKMNEILAGQIFNFLKKKGLTPK
jgi:hypothetical protein